jgi:spore maturation protein CgeB
MKIVLLNTNGVYSHLLTYSGIKEGLFQVKKEDPEFDFIEVNIGEQDGPKIYEYNPDFILVVTPLCAGLRVWKKYRRKKVICYDTEGLYENLGIDTLPYCDIMATVDKFGAEKYKEIVAQKGMNCKIYHMPLGFSPSVFRFQNVPEEFKSDICLAGVMFDRRRKILEDLYPIRDKIRLRVITPKDWANRIIHKDAVQFLHSEVVSPEEMVKYYCGAKIVLCVNRDYSPANQLGKQSSTPGRVFQEAACRRMVMLDNSRPEVNDYFVDGKEIVLFDSDNGEDLRQKVLYYLEHEEEREAIAHNGCQRTMNENTWKHRMQGLLRFVSNE